MMQIGAVRKFTVQQTDGVMPGLYGAQVCRTRYIDDVVQAGQAQGIGQVVILGAGLDTRAYRLPGMERVKVFEVDLPAVQAGKKKSIQKALGRMPENVTFVPIDFDTQTLDAALAGTGYDASQPAIFVWEGVTQYITVEAVRRTLAFVGKAAPGSAIAFTYVLKSIIERRSDLPGAEKMMAQVARQAPWIFGLEPAEAAEYLQPFGLTLVEDVGSAQYQERYLKPIGRVMDVSEAERIIKARREE
jgi:methyltransferase (TIGR00027 family)